MFNHGRDLTQTTTTFKEKIFEQEKTAATIDTSDTVGDLLIYGDDFVIGRAHLMFNHGGDLTQAATTFNARD